MAIDERPRNARTYRSASATVPPAATITGRVPLMVRTSMTANSARPSAPIVTQ